MVLFSLPSARSQQDISSLDLFPTPLNLNTNMLLPKIIRQGPKRTLAKQQIDLFKTHSCGLLENEKDRGERHNEIKARKYKVVFPCDAAERNWGDLRKERADKPVANARCKSVSSGADGHGHDLGHVDPRNRTPGYGKNHRDTEDEKDACNRQPVTCAIDILTVYGRFTDESNGNTDSAKNERSPPSSTIEERSYEDKVGQRANAIVYARHQQVRVPGDAESIVHDGLVVANDVDASELGEDLHKHAVHEPQSPLRHGEHDAPARCSNGFLGCDCGLDFMEFSLDPILVLTIVMELLEDLHSLIFAVCLYKMAGRLGEEKKADKQDHGWDGLKGKGKSPLELTRNAI